MVCRKCWCRGYLCHVSNSMGNKSCPSASPVWMVKTNLVVTVPADSLAHNGARPSADTVMTKQTYLLPSILGHQWFRITIHDTMIFWNNYYIDFDIVYGKMDFMIGFIVLSAKKCIPLQNIQKKEAVPFYAIGLFLTRTDVQRACIYGIIFE